MTTIEPKARPMIFTTESIRAYQQGLKWMTRRIMDTQPVAKFGGVHGVFDGYYSLLDKTDADINHFPNPTPYQTIKCRYGKPGDLIWFRETWAMIPDDGGTLIYRADDPEDNWMQESGVTWKSPMFMPRRASRYTVPIVSIRAERLWDIRPGDALAEGCGKRECVCCNGTGDYDGAACLECSGDGVITERGSFRARWDSINGKRASWASNPWVWVIEFERLHLGG
ncbi:MAG: hypothetical protein ABI977_11930 [Acidobacteriota bacterium]